MTALETIAARARELVAAIRANVDRYYADEISYDDFGAEQRRLWDTISADGQDSPLNVAVLALLRDDFTMFEQVTGCAA